MPNLDHPIIFWVQLPPAPHNIQNQRNLIVKSQEKSRSLEIAILACFSIYNYEYQGLLPFTFFQYGVRPQILKYQKDQNLYRTSSKNLILTSFRGFFVERDFSRKIRLRQLVPIVLKLRAKFRKDPMTSF